MVHRENGLGPWWRSRSPRVQDALIATLTLVGCGVLILAELGPVTGTGNDRPWLRLTLAAAMCALQSQRRSYPTIALALAAVPVAVDAWFGATLPVLVVLTDLVYAATLYSRPVRLATITRGVLAAAGIVVIGAGFVTEDLRYTVFAALLAAAFLISPMLTGYVVRQHRDSAAWQREKATADRRVADLRHRTALNAERTRMARELHDVISGHLSAIALQTEALIRHQRAGTDPRDGRLPALESVRSQSVQALAAMRSMIDMLRREDTDPGGAADLSELPVSLAGALDELRGMVESTGSHLRLQVQPRELPELPAAVELAAYRVAAEALANTVKHAPGADVELSITAVPGRLTVLVRNEFGGATIPDPADPRPGQGLANMLHRVTSTGGAFTAGPDAQTPGHWTVEARFVLSPSLSPGLSPSPSPGLTAAAGR